MKYIVIKKYDLNNKPEKGIEFKKGYLSALTYEGTEEQAKRWIVRMKGIGINNIAIAKEHKGEPTDSSFTWKWNKNKTDQYTLMVE